LSDKTNYSSKEIGKQKSPSSNVGIELPRDEYIYFDFNGNSLGLNDMEASIIQELETENKQVLILPYI
jgi:hypothetical protein